MDSRTKGNIVVGAIVSFVFSAYAGGPLIGGAVAGYLEGSDLRWGIRVGAMAGIVALAVSTGLTAVNLVLGIGSFGVREVLAEGIYYPMLTGLLPFVVLPLVGGGVGSYVRRETGE